MIEETKKCPYCAEEIQAEAVKCRYCGEFLTSETRAAGKPAEPAPARGCSPVTVVLLVVGGFVVVIMIGIMAAIAIPQLVNASERGRQRRTMADMRNFATANGTMRVDTGQYAETLADLQTGGYLQGAPLSDGWGNPWIYRREGNSYTITSLGSDGAAGPVPPAMWTDAPYDPDIVLMDGQFLQAPRGR